MHFKLILLLLLCAHPVHAQVHTLRVTETAPERVVTPGKPHVYAVTLPANHFVTGAADQRSVDVVVRVLDPAGKQLGSWDGPARGDERFRFTTAGAGEYRIEVAAFEKDSGAYALRLIRAQPAATEPGARVDQIMSDYDSTTPGGVVAVVQDGKLVFARGYGLANLEHGIPNSPATTYHMASVSKQFTAFAILLLAQQGKLSLDDDIRKHLPELHDFGTPITIRHLVHHTSGLRDQWTLWAMAGGRLDDVITQNDLLNLIQRQRELNFAPGSEHMYSNTGYTLLAEIAARVAREPFGVWMKRTVFDPLGMTHTQIFDDHERIVKGRAESYRRNEQTGQWVKSVLSYANRGATSLFTTAPDLALWLDNFRTGKVGGAALIEQMKQRGVLNRGDTLGYAFGIVHGKQRGLATIGHGGADAGFRTGVTYFPELNAGIIVLGNDASFNPGRIGNDMAEAFFAERMSPSPPPPAAPNPQAPSPPEWKPSAQELEAYAGSYYSPELETRYTVAVKNGGLVAQHRRHGEFALRPHSADEFRAGSWYFSQIRFQRDPQGRVTDMRVSSGRVRNLRFERVP